jgi:hypothetical protein
MSSKAVHLVVQRYRSCKLLLNETEWVCQGSRAANHCGLLLYVSFAADADQTAVSAAVDTALNLPVLTTGLWGDGVSEQFSVKQQLLTQNCNALTTSITIVPQANLICKVRKSILFSSAVRCSVV